MDPVTHKEEVGNRLRLAIEALNLKPKDLNEKFGVSPSRLGHYMSGRHFPDEWFLYRFCSRYLVSADWIYLGRLSGMEKGLADALWSVSEASSAASEDMVVPVIASSGNTPSQKPSPKL